MANIWEGLGALGSGFQQGMQQGRQQRVQQGMTEKTYLDSLKEAQKKEQTRLSLSKGMENFPMDGDHEALMEWFATNAQYMGPNERWKFLQHVQDVKGTADKETTRLQGLEDTEAARVQGLKDWEHKEGIRQQHALARQTAQRAPYPEDQATLALQQQQQAAQQAVTTDMLRMGAGGQPSTEGQFASEVQGFSQAPGARPQLEQYILDNAEQIALSGLGGGLLESVAAGQRGPKRLTREKALQHTVKRVNTLSANMYTETGNVLTKEESDAVIAQVMAMWDQRPDLHIDQIMDAVLNPPQQAAPASGGLDPEAAALLDKLGLR